ncbi:MAG: hypothetical protein FD167_372, partial [bacterium]
PSGIGSGRPNHELSLEQLLAQIESNRKLCWLKAIISSDEQGNGCITIMLPLED